MHRIAVVVILALASGTPSARAQGEYQWRTRVETALTNSAKSLTAQGYEHVRETLIGSLHDSENDSITLTLHAGKKYALVGVCDSDCKDLDLVLYDANGDQIDSDIQNDDVPIVQVTPRETQRYRVKVIMANCQMSPCWYGIGVYGK